MFKKIPLAWLQLSHEKIRLLVAIAGISFADILMFMQLGFRDALFDSAVKFHTNVTGDVFLISPQSTALISMKSFPRRRTVSIPSLQRRRISHPYLPRLWYLEKPRRQEHPPDHDYRLQSG